MIQSNFRYVVVLGCLMAGSSFAQQVISAKSGLINYTEGQVFLGDSLVKQKFGEYQDIKTGQHLRTEEGRAESSLPQECSSVWRRTPKLRWWPTLLPIREWKFLRVPWSWRLAKSPRRLELSSWFQAHASISANPVCSASTRLIRPEFAPMTARLLSFRMDSRPLSKRAARCF